MLSFIAFSLPEFHGRSWQYSVYIQVFLIVIKETRYQPRDRKKKLNGYDGRYYDVLFRCKKGI